MQQQSTQFKNLDQLRCYTTNPAVLEVIDKFLFFKKTVNMIVDRIETSILTSIVEAMPDHMFGLIKTQTQISQAQLSYFLDDLMNYSTLENQQIHLEIKKQTKKVESLKLSYQNTLNKFLKPLHEILTKTEQLIFSKIESNAQLTLMRLKNLDEGIALELNGLTYESIMMFVCVFEPKVDSLLFKGILQPILFDGIYYEQPFNSRQEPHKIKYRIHQGMNLREALYEEVVNIFHPEMKLVGEHNYEIEFKSAVKLYKGHKYCISATCGEQDDFFATSQFVMKDENNAILEFQDRDYSENDFVLPDYIQMINCQKEGGSFPGFIVQQDS